MRHPLILYPFFCLYDFSHTVGKCCVGRAVIKNSSFLNINRHCFKVDFPFYPFALGNNFFLCKIVKPNAFRQIKLFDISFAHRLQNRCYKQIIAEKIFVVNKSYISVLGIFEVERSHHRQSCFCEFLSLLIDVRHMRI